MSLNIGDIVRLKHSYKIDYLLWMGSGIILDIMEMNDGFPMIEVAFGTSIEWFPDLELELVTK